ncbi:MAG: hypothetical protein R3204_09295 [Oceanospirillum sp.]|nr:hypothetical protein [Oceanospirillum sp.]
MAQYFRYYQTHEKGKWEAVPESNGLEDKLKQQGAKRISVLSVSALVDENTELDKLVYRGPFYVDIDNGSIVRSINAAREFLEKLKALKVPEHLFEVHASGSK